LGKQDRSDGVALLAGVLASLPGVPKEKKGKEDTKGRLWTDHKKKTEWGVGGLGKGISRSQQTRGKYTRYIIPSRMYKRKRKHRPAVLSHK